MLKKLLVTDSDEISTQINTAIWYFRDIFIVFYISGNT